ncbi:MAG: hypothetical protein DHS20C09_00390 [marine bacterium B5-7]|nr:MAG: hypothetical protein DHS20C09_00390 [marine bacterium B5-7]
MDEILFSLEKFKPLIDFFVALIPIALAILGSYIAIQQYRTNRKKLKIELFDKRYAVFIAINQYLGVVMRDVSVDHSQRSEYLAGTRGAEFLFKKEITEYIDEIWSKSIDLCTWAEDELTSTHATERGEHMKWFGRQFSEIDERFKKYMQLEH